MSFLDSKYRISPCPRCGREVPDTHPYCDLPACLAYSITDVQRSPQGGYLTYVDTYKHPLRAYPRDIDLHFVDLLKRAVISNIRFLVSFPITPRRFQEAIFVWMGELYDSTFRPHERRQEDEYSQSSREIRRALRKVNPSSRLNMERMDGSLDDRWISYGVEIWETDQAYRNRGQDGFSLLNKENLKKNPRKEILRIWDTVMSREVMGGQVPKMKAMRKVLLVLLWSPRIRNLITAFFMELDLNEIKISIEDRYWMANRFDYNYEGKTFEERMDWKAQEHENWIPAGKKAEIPHIGINPPNEAFYKLTGREAAVMAEEAKQALIKSWKEKQRRI